MGSRGPVISDDLRIEGRSDVGQHDEIAAVTKGRECDSGQLAKGSLGTKRIEQRIDVGSNQGRRPSISSSHASTALVSLKLNPVAKNVSGNSPNELDTIRIC